MSYNHPEGTSTLAEGALRVLRKLESAGTTIGVAQGWQTLSDGTRSLTGSFQSCGGTACTVNLGGSAVVVTGGSVRVVINGGDFATNTVIASEPATLAIGTQRIAQFGHIDIPTTNDLVTYSVTAQGQGVGLLASITPSVNTALAVFEYPQ